MAVRAAIDVFRFRDHRAFLRAYYERQKATRDGFSLRAFSRRARLRSPNYLKLVMDGDRNLTPEMAVRFAEACGLGGEPAEYFVELCAFCQAKNARVRARHYQRLQSFRRFRKVHRLDAAQDAYHSHWFIPAIRELVLRRDFRDDPKWIANVLLPRITPKDAEKALKTLESLGMLVRDDAGRWRQAETLVETRDGPLGHHVAGFHRAMMRHAGEAIDRVPREEREISSLTLCLSQSQLQQLKADLERIRAELLQRYLPDDDAKRVVQVNVQMFPLSEEGE
ncbi:MAG: TIGR02147 family protein [Myxococcales bacterium]|nr:TIGR02147 family protein [Myxococcales bacterium]